MTIPSFRVLNGAAFLACTGMMAYALYAEHQLLLEPCPLCVFERMAISDTPRLAKMYLQIAELLLAD